MSEHTTFWPAAPDLQRAEVPLHFRGNDYVGHLVAPPASAGPRPLVLVIHNYAGLKFFDVDQAEYLARLGYVGLAIDVYGNKISPEERLWSKDPEKLKVHMRKSFAAMASLDHDHELFRAVLGAWLDLGLKQSCVDASLPPVAIGYCFGGVAVLEAVRGGLNLSGVVSFHGLLQTGEDGAPASAGIERPPLKRCENRYNTRTIVRIENGADDPYVLADNRTRFFEEMNAAGVDWSFHDYARTPHGFALPPTLGPPGALHESSDRRSTMAMLGLLREVFPNVPQAAVQHNAAGTRIPA
jgi:dienelactone hydrolase